MRFHGQKLTYRAGLLFSLLLGTHAVPSINVALRTSFGAPPYLVELLYAELDSNNKTSQY